MMITFSCMAVDKHQTNEDYDMLWKELHAFENQNLPQSAFEVAQKIYQLALDDKRDDQLIKSIIFKQKLSKQFEDLDPVEYIVRAENEYELLHSEAAKSIYASFLAELYFQYGNQNQYRFKNRTTSSSDDLPAFSSLEAIQRKALDLYQKSLEYNKDYMLKNFSEILKYDASPFRIIVKDVKSFLQLRALYHFTNSRSLVSIVNPLDRIENPDFFKSNTAFSQIDLVVTDNAFKAQALKLFQSLTNNPYLNNDEKEKLYLLRLDYLKNQSSIARKEELYLESLEEFSVNAQTNAGKALSYIKRLEYYLSKAQSSSEVERSNEYALKAQTTLEKANEVITDESFLTILKKQKERFEQRDLDLEMEQVLIPNQAHQLRLAYKNMDRVYFRLFKLNSSQRSTWLEKRRSEEQIAYLSEVESHSSWNSQLPSENIYFNNSTVLPLDPQDVGFYVLQVSNNNDFSYGANDVLSVNSFQVSGLSYFTDQQASSFSAQVLDRWTGVPISGVSVLFFESRYDSRTRRQQWYEIGETTSNNQGEFYSNSKSNNVVFLLKNGSDKMVSILNLVNEGLVFQCIYKLVPTDTLKCP